MSSGQSVVIPDCQLQAGVGQVRQGQVVPAQGVFPARTNGLATNGSFLFCRTVVGWQKITGKNSKKFDFLFTNKYIYFKTFSECMNVLIICFEINILKGRFLSRFRFSLSMQIFVQPVLYISAKYL